MIIMYKYKINTIYNINIYNLLYVNSVMTHNTYKYQLMCNPTYKILQNTKYYYKHKIYE